MTMVYAAALLGGVLFCASLALVAKNAQKPDKTALAVLREAPVTVIFSPFLLAVAVLVAVARKLDPTVGGEGVQAVWMTAALVLLCGAGAGFVLLFTYVRRAVAYADRLEVRDVFGRTRTLPWNEITGVHTSLTSKGVTLRAGRQTVRLNGDPAVYRDFVQKLYDHVPARVGSDTLGQLLQRLQ